jgi:ElaB/YqjD/DUF883 family membrane-anchored ribosome-binding protein
MVSENETPVSPESPVSDEPTTRPKRAAKKVTRTLDKVEQRLMTTAESMRDRAAKTLREGELDLKEFMQGMTDWVVENPKMAIGVCFSSGALVGLLAGSRFGRALLLGGLAMASRRLV